MLKVPAVIKHVQLHVYMTCWPDGGRGRGLRRGGQQSQDSPQRFQASIPPKSCAYVGDCGTVVARMRVGPVRKSDYVSCA